MTAKYTVIDSQVLSTSAASVTFSSIPGGYKDLVLVLGTGGVAGSSARLRFNSDTGANYSWVRMEGNGSSAASASGTGSFLPLSGNIYTDTGLTYNVQVSLLDFAATDKHKSVLHRVNQTTEPTYGGVGTAAHASRWANTAAITNIEVYGTTFAIGSTFFLYQIVSE